MTITQHASACLLSEVPHNITYSHVSDPKQGGFNSFAHHNGRKYSTSERDNDNHGGNCVVRYNTGGWWYGSCYDLCLTESNASIG